MPKVGVGVHHRWALTGVLHRPGFFPVFLLLSVKPLCVEQKKKKTHHRK
uniref:Uncharacterized protein n=1 Tax=Anguilla anguilla TaxID=7936 RepID=A0A0E9TAK0_ANGAN